jgi:hypothetical protein
MKDLCLAALTLIPLCETSFMLDQLGDIPLFVAGILRNEERKGR